MRCGLAFGSNLGDRLSTLTAARRALAQHCTVLGAAPIYETDPVGCPAESPPFLNSVVEVEWPGPVGALHELTRQLERQYGRPDMRTANAPRPLDLDLLYFGEQIVQTSSLILPHPRLHLRRFVLQPLADLRPDLILPGFRESISVLLGQLGTDEAPLRLHTRHWS